MRQLGNLNFLVIFSILFLINDTSGLRCWRCSSDASNSKFCGDTLDLSQITVQQKRWNYVECDVKPPNNVDNIENLIPKCRILLQHVNDVPTYTRSCYWEQENVPVNSCLNMKFNPSYVKTVACNTCTEDGCNDKLLSASTEEDKVEANQKNSAILSVLSNAVFAIFVLSMVIGY